MKRPTAGFKKREVLEKACKIGKTIIFTIFFKTEIFVIIYKMNFIICFEQFQKTKPIVSKNKHYSNKTQKPNSFLQKRKIRYPAASASQKHGQNPFSVLFSS